MNQERLFLVFGLALAGAMASACSDSGTGGSGGAASAAATSSSGGGSGGATSSSTGSTTATATTSTTTSGGGGQGGGAGGGGASSSSAGGGGAGGGPCVDSLAPLPVAPPTLDATGLYADLASKTLAPYVQDFAVAFTLWSDGSDKTRWVYLPECTPIDTTDMDHWVLPVGTRFWKQFVFQGVLVETRLEHKFGPGPQDWLFATYQWDLAGQTATLVVDGVEDANGTTHDIPRAKACMNCHGGLPERSLGFGAFQLSHSGPGATIASLSAAGKLTTPAPQGFAPPGDPTIQAALGYMHANCGHCHYDAATAPPGFDLRLLVSQTTPEQTGAYITSIGQTLADFSAPGVTHRVAAGDPAASGVIYRMFHRGDGDLPAEGDVVQMPPLASEVIDDQGVQIVSDWILGL